MPLLDREEGGEREERERERKREREREAETDRDRHGLVAFSNAHPPGIDSTAWYVP